MDVFNFRSLKNSSHTKLLHLMVLLLILTVAFGPLNVVHVAKADTQTDAPIPGVNEPAQKPGPQQPPAFYSAADQKILNAKVDLADKNSKVRKGLYDKATYEKEWALFLASVGEKPSKANDINTNGVRPNTNSVTRYLGVFQSPQQTSYYCGPAAGYELLSFLNNTTSSYNTHPSLSQSNLAGSDYFQTTTNGTPWWIGSASNKVYVVPRGLNRWRTGTDTGFYEAIAWAGQPNSSQVASFQTQVTSDIDSNYPAMGDAYEVQGYDHLVGHPTNLTIYHWITFTGYDSSGAQLQYADSVYGDGSNTSWSGSVTSPKSQMSTNTIAGILGGYGYVW